MKKERGLCCQVWKVQWSLLPGMKKERGLCCQVWKDKWSLLLGLKREVVPVARYEERSGPCCQLWKEKWSLLPVWKEKLSLLPGMKREVIPVAKYEKRSGPCCQEWREKWSLLLGMKKKVVPVARNKEKSGPCCQLWSEKWSLLEVFHVFRFEKRIDPLEVTWERRAVGYRMESEEVPVRRCEDKRGPGGTGQVREVRTAIYFKHKVQIANRSEVFNLSLSWNKWSWKLYLEGKVQLIHFYKKQMIWHIPIS